MGATNDMIGIVAGIAKSVPGSAAEAAVEAQQAAEAAAAEAQEILESIPEDYSELSADVSDLKSAINSNANNSSVTWVLGTLAGGANKGKENTSTTRIRSSFIPVMQGAHIVVTGNASCLQVFSFNEYKEYITDDTWASEFTVPSGVSYVRIVVRASSSNPTIASEDIDEQAQRCIITLKLNQSSYFDTYTDKVMASEFAKLDALCAYDGYLVSNDWEMGNITGGGADKNATNRARTVGYVLLSSVSSVFFSVANGYKYAIYWYNDQNSLVNINDNGTWQTNDSTYTSWTGATKFRLIIAKTDDSDVSASIHTNLTAKLYASLNAVIGNGLSELKKQVTPHRRFTVTQGNVHSSANDQLDTDIAAGQTYYLFINTTGATVNSEVYLVNDADEKTKVLNSTTNVIIKLTAPYHIKRIGVFTAIAAENMTVDLFAVNDGQLEYLMYEYTKWFVSSRYNQVSIPEKLTDYGKLFKGGSTADAFLFFTDPHIFPYTMDEDKMERAIGTLEQAYNNSPASFVLCGGDWLQNNDTQDEACYKLGRINGIMRAKFGKDYYPILGNHDTNYQGKLDSESAQYTGELPQGTIDAMWFYRWGRAYYDFETANARYYVFDSGLDNASAMDAYRWAQVDWFAESLLEHDDAHSVIGLHIFTKQSKADYEEDPTAQLLAENLTLVAQAYNARGTVTLNSIPYDFSSATGKVALMIAGHTHYDLETEYNDIPVFVTTTATYVPTFDLIHLDFDNGLLTAIRVGSGDNRTLTIVT